MAPVRWHPPAIFLVLLYALTLLLRGQVWSGAGIDEVHYYAPAASLAWDGDLALTNDLLEARTDYGSRRRVAERLYRDGELDLPFAIGMSVFEAPQVVTGRALDSATGGWLGGNDRYAWFHRSAPTLLTWLLVLAGLLACQRVAERFCSPWRAAGLVAAIFLSINLAFYTWHASAMAHGASFGAAALLLLATVRYREAPSTARALQAGLLVGVAFLLRWQEVLLAVLPLAAVIAAWRGGRRPAELLPHLLAMAAGAVLMAGPQFVFWRLMFGRWALLPQGAGFFTWDWSRPVLVLLSPLNGWLTAHPAVALLLLAFVPAWRREGRWLWSAALAAVAASIAVNSLAGDWWGGGSFGARRFTGTQALLIVPAAMAAGRLGRRGFAAWMAVFGALAAVNFVVVARWAQVGAPVFLWSNFARDGAAWLQFLGSSREVLLSSDLFNFPSATDHPCRVRALFVIAVAAVAAAGLAADAIARRPALRLRLRWPALAVMVALPLAWSLLALRADRPFDGPARGWSRTVADALAREDDRTIRARAVRQPTGPEFQGMVDVYRLEEALLREHDDEAVALTNKLLPLLPRTVLDVWASCTPIEKPLRDEWLPKLQTVPDPSPGALAGLHQEAAALRREPALEALHQRLSGPRWQRDLRLLQRDFWAAASPKDLQRRIDRCLRTNPFNTAPLMEGIRLHQSEPKAAARAIDRLRVVTEDYLEPARLVSRWHPSEWAAFEPGWRGAAWQRIEALDLLGRAAEAREELAAAEALGLRAREAEQLTKRLDEAQLVEDWMAGRATTDFPTGTETTLPEVDKKAIAWVNAQWLRRSDGWGVMETTPGQVPWRWTYSEISFLRLSGPIPAGKHRFVFYAYAFPGERYRTPISIDLYGEEGAVTFDAPEGHFWHSVELTATHDHARPLLRLHHALAPINSYHKDSDDTRRVGLLFYVGWME